MGHVIRNISGEQQNNRSFIMVDKCSVEDFGEYMCTAWKEVDGAIYWSNVTTYLTVYGMVYHYKHLDNICNEIYLFK